MSDIKSILLSPNEEIIAVVNMAGAQNIKNKGRNDERFAILTDTNLYLHGQEYLFYSVSPKRWRLINRNRDNTQVVPVNQITSINYGRSWRNTNFWRVMLFILWILAVIIATVKMSDNFGCIISVAVGIMLPILIKIGESVPYLSCVALNVKHEHGISAKGFDENELESFKDALVNAKKANEVITQQLAVQQQASMMQAFLQQLPPQAQNRTNVNSQ